MTPGKSVVLVTVDCLRADHVGFMGYQKPTTPFLDGLAKQSFVVPSAIVAGTPTYYSFPAIMASRYPLGLGRDVIGLAPGEVSLASVFQRAGYVTGAFVAANPYLAAQFGYDQGFDFFIDFSDLRSGAEPTHAASARSRLNQALKKASRKTKLTHAIYNELYFEYCQRWGSKAPETFGQLRQYPAADEVIGRAKAWLESIGDSPFFLWIHLMDTHAPYYPTQEALEIFKQPPPSPFRARYLNSFWNRSDIGPARRGRYRNRTMDLYDSNVCLVDRQIRELVEGLQAAQRWDECIFAVTADHGEEFLEHGGRFHSPSALTEELVHVPLLLRVPGTTPRKVTSAPFSLLHLAPTLLEPAGFSISHEFRGKSLWRQLRDGKGWNGPAIVESIAGCTNPLRPERRFGSRALAVRDEQFKLILDFDGGSDRLYDLAQDEREQSPLPSGAEKHVRRRLLDCARQHIAESLNGAESPLRLKARLRNIRPLLVFTS